MDRNHNDVDRNSDWLNNIVEDKMKCPRCGNDYAVVKCANCNHVWTNEAIDSTELLRLINKAIERKEPFRSGWVSKEERDRWIKAQIFDAVRAALETGDLSALKKLAGTKEPLYEN